MNKEKHNAILIDPKDNVAVAIDNLKKGQMARVKGDNYFDEITLAQDIPFGHKLALGFIQEDEEIIKYGEVIGAAMQNIEKGEHVHEHNIIGIRGKREAKQGKEF